MTDTEMLEGEELYSVDPEEEKRLMTERLAQNATVMDTFGADLTSALNDAVTFRSDFERDWQNDIAQYEYGDPSSTSSSRSKDAPAESDTVFRRSKNITKKAVITYAARLSDMLFPTNDRNWDLEATPSPQIPEDVLSNAISAIQENNPDVAIDDALTNTVKVVISKKRAAKMRTLIEDRLSESRYASHGRRMILDACKIGHGVLKGPLAKTVRKRRYQSGAGFSAAMVEEMTEPCVERVDPWMVFPRPCRRIADCPGVFELHQMTARRVAELASQPGFSSYQIGRLLKQEPSWDLIASSITTMREIGPSTHVLASNAHYAVWEYNGELPREAFETFVGQLVLEGSISTDAAASLLEEATREASALQCSAFMSQGIVLKITIQPIEYQKCGVYKFFVFDEHENAPFGKSIPWQLRESQGDVRTLWRSIVHNAVMSSAPQIGVKKGALVAERGGAIDLTFEKPRIWYFNDEVEDINKAMQSYTVPNTVAGIQPVYEMAKRDADEEVMLPAIAGGDPTQSVQTASGMAMLMNASNIVQRLLASRFDDDVTAPLIESMFEWFMQYGPEEAKGDYKTIAKASSHLLVKDVQAQNFLMAMSLYSNNPQLAKRMKWEAWAEEGLRIMDIDYNRFLLTLREVEQADAAAAETPQKDPDTIRAEASMMHSQARMTEAQARIDIAQKRVEMERNDSLLGFEDKIADRETRERIAAMKVQEAMAGLDSNAQLRVMEIQAKMEADANRNAEETRRAGMEVSLKAEEMAQRDRRDQIQLAVERPNPRLM
jgi:hypothetical protein